MPSPFVLQPFYFMLARRHTKGCNSPTSCMDVQSLQDIQRHYLLSTHNMFSKGNSGGAGSGEKRTNCAPQGVLVVNNTTTSLSVHYPSIPLLSPASPDFNYHPSGMKGIQWRRRLRSTSPVSCACFIFLVSHFQD